MKLLITSDIHCRFEKFANMIIKAWKSEKPDALLIAGDITNTGSQKEWEGFEGFFGVIQSELKNQVDEKSFFVTGNHDNTEELNQAALFLRYIDHITDRTTVLNGLNIKGFNLTTCFTAPDLALHYKRMTPYRDFDLGYYTLQPYADIILSHSPPSGLELTKMTWKGQRLDIGSPGLRQYIEKHQPKLVVCGHVHEGSGMIEKIGNTTIVNTAETVMLIEI